MQGEWTECKEKRSEIHFSRTESDLNIDDEGDFAGEHVLLQVPIIFGTQTLMIN